MWKISLLDLCNDIKYCTEYKPIMSSGLIHFWCIYIYLIGYLQQSLYDYNFTAYQIVHYNYLHVDDLLISFFFYLINAALLLINISVERYIHRFGTYISVSNKGVCLISFNKFSYPPIISGLNNTEIN